MTTSNTMFRALALALTFSATANAHLFIKEPAPIPGSDTKPPLDPSGSDWPCKMPGQLPTTGGQKMQAGSDQALSFELGAGANTAVHGGGSCQVSLTYETDPEKQADPSNWKVIHSMVGGCPSSTPLNLQPGQAVNCGDPGAAGHPDCMSHYNFTIPEGVKEGHAILAWTWFNAIGNREMYMNCVNTEIVGGDGSGMDSFPTMFAANIGSAAGTECTTQEQTNVQFPYCGDMTEDGPTEYTNKKPTGPCADMGKPKKSSGGSGSSSSPDSGSSGSDSDSPAQPPAYSAPAPQTTSAAEAAPAPSSPPTYDDGSWDSGDDEEDDVTATTTMQTVTSAAPAQTQAPAAPAPGPDNYSSDSGSGACESPKVSCPNPGAIICMDGGHFGICGSDNCALPQEVSQGNECANGAVAKRSTRRHLSAHRRRHLGDDN